MTRFSMTRTTSLLLPLLALFVVSCSDSTSPGGGDGQMPAEGSTYSTTVTVQSDQGAVISSKDQTATVESAPGYNGKENVSKYVVEGGGQDMYVAFEDDGNVSVEFLLTLAGQSELIWTPITVTPGSAIDEIKMFGRYDIRIEGNPQFTRQVLTGYSLK